MNKKPEIYVDYEYGDLKEVIVGVPLLIYPDLEIADWLQEALKILPDHEREKVIERSGKSSRNMDKYNALEKENQELISIFQRHGVKVWRPDILTDEQVKAALGEEKLKYSGVNFQYSRDPILITGENVIELRLSTLTLSNAFIAYSNIFLNRVFGSNAKWFSMPQPNFGDLMEGGIYNKSKWPLLEGGDILLLGNKILVGTSLNNSVGSSELGYLWLKSILEPQGYKIERVKMINQILHLDCILSVVKPGLIIACRDGFVDGLPSYFKDWKVIEVSINEAQLLATNGMPIDVENYILPYNEEFDGKRVQEELEVEGVKVYRISYSNHTEDGGAVRCTTHPLYRKLTK